MTGDSTPLLMSILQGAHASLSVLHLSLGCASLCLAYIKTSHLMSDVLIILTSTCMLPDTCFVPQPRVCKPLPTSRPVPP